MVDIEIIMTSDGSHSLRHPLLNETFHSTHGAIQESVHVFITHGLLAFPKRASLRILEIGFGTGLNALLTLIHSRTAEISIHYTTLEPNPLDKAIVSQLNYVEFLGSDQGAIAFEKLHGAAWDEEVSITHDFILRKQLTPLQEFELGVEKFDLVYFDAFAPSKQPELWEISVLEKVEQSMKSNAIFITYCAKGQLKRDLKSLGLRVETLAGPPGKKEMVRATKP